MSRLSSPPRAEAEPSRPVTLIRPAGGWQRINFGELWRHRELIYFLGWRDVKVRYKQTLLGAAWAVLQPILMMVVFTLFFSRLGGVSSGDFPYPLFVFAGLLPWTFFANAITNASNSVVGSERLISKIYFPRLAIPLGSVGAALVDFGVAFGLLIVLMLAYGVLPGIGLLLAPVIFAGIVLVAVGVGTLLAALNVAYRDFRYVVPFMVQLWMFATPTVYMQPPAGSSTMLQTLLALNPMTGLIAAFRAAVLGGTLPWGQLLCSLVAAVAIVLTGCFYFRKVEDSFVDII